MPRRLMTVLAAALMTASSTEAHARSENQTWNRDFEVTQRPTVRIETDDAQVVVRSWNERRVSARVERIGRTEGLVFGASRPDVSITRTGNEVRVVARDRNRGGIIVFSSSRMTVEVWLPVESDLIVQSSDGAVTVEDVSGRIDLETQDGRLTARDLRGDIAVRTQDGRVELDGIDGALRLETQDARSQIRGRFDRFDLRSQDGGIEAELLPGSLVRAGGWSVRSADGGIDLRLPRDLVATLDAQTQDGSLQVDLPVRIQGGVRRHHLVADLNGGGPLVRLRSNDGPIRVASIE